MQHQMKDETNTEKSWKEIKQKIQETAEEVLG